MSIKKFILSRRFARHLAIALTFMAFMIIIMLLFLNLYTRHGQSRPVPDFRGRTLDEAGEIAAKNRLRYKVVDSVYSSLVPRGNVADQNPKPGIRVKKWRTISLIVNAFRPEMVAMPDLVNLPLRQALKLIEMSGLKIGILIPKADISVDVVLAQLNNNKEVAANDSLQKESVIDLVIGKGLSNIRTPVPDLTGMRLEHAAGRILDASLNLATFTYDNTVLTADDSLNAFVYKQKPDGEEDAKIGDIVYLWLTIDSTRLPRDSSILILPDTLTRTGTDP
jgi:beta-lactam-binding protein with PASTA domain